MSETDLQKEINKAIHKVYNMRIDSGQSQYQGRGEDSAEEVDETKEVPERSNIYDQEEENTMKAARDILKDIKNRAESVNLGQSDTTKLVKKLNKINSMLGSAAVGGELDLKSKLKHLKTTDPKLYYKLKAKLDLPGKQKKKAKKPKGGAKREMSEGQRRWLDFVKEMSKKEKYKGMKRKDLLKVASEKYKRQA